MSLSSRLSKFFSKSEVNKMDDAAKRAAGSPGYDDDTKAAQKEFAKEKKVEASKKLTKKEEAAADKEAYASAMGKDKPAAKKGPLTAKEKKELQDSLEFRKGGSVTKMAKGGYANCGASMKPAQKAAGKATKTPVLAIMIGVPKGKKK
jgi:phage-related tail protein